MAREVSKRFTCKDCGKRLGRITSSRNRSGEYKIRHYSCSCGQITKTIEVELPREIRGNTKNGLSELRAQILEEATGKELLEALKWKLL